MPENVSIKLNSQSGKNYKQFSGLTGIRKGLLAALFLISILLVGCLGSSTGTNEDGMTLGATGTSRANASGPSNPSDYEIWAETCFYTVFCQSYPENCESFTEYDLENLRIECVAASHWQKFVESVPVDGQTSS